MTLTEERLIELEELNIEFTETLMVATQKVLDFADKHNLEFPERIALGHLLKRAASTLNAMRDPLGHDVTKSKQNLLTQAFILQNKETGAMARHLNRACFPA